MNQFRTRGVPRSVLEIILISAWTITAVNSALAWQSQKPDGISKPPQVPYSENGEFIFADIDTLNQRVFVLLKDGLWQFELEQERWQFLDSLTHLPEKISELEFGYNPESNKIQFWSRGVGKFIDVDPETFDIKRIDRSHNHRNQFGHQPFFKDGVLYAFGGYGYWKWKNILTFYNRDLREWNIQNVAPTSPLPEGRIPEAGVYDPIYQNFLVFGGSRPSSPERSDDQFTERINNKDIWKYSFTNDRWENILTLQKNEFRFYKASMLNRVERINAISTSFFSNNSGIWYLPMAKEGRIAYLYFVVPIDVRSGIELPTIELKFGQSKEFLPTNFLFNEPTQSVVVVGTDYLSESDIFPVRIVQIPEDSLISQMPEPEYATFMDDFIVYLSGLVAVGVVFFFLYKKKTGSVQSESKDVSSTYSRLQDCEWLNSQEKALIERLYTSGRPLESQELEEMLWDDIESFDYRRKLRNECIKSINRKFASNYPDHEELIVRTKDPNDNRRYFYSLLYLGSD